MITKQKTTPNDRSYAGTVGLPGSVVLRLNGQPTGIGQRTQLPSRAALTLNKDGAWLYEPPNTAAQTSSIDHFECDVHTDGKLWRETISIAFEPPSTAAKVLIEADSQTEQQHGDSNHSVRLLVDVFTACESQIDLTPISKTDSPAVIILKSSPDGEARINNHGKLSFQPAAGFVGTTQLQCLVETIDGSSVKAQLLIEVRSPVQIQSSRLPL